MGQEHWHGKVPATTFGKEEAGNYYGQICRDGIACSVVQGESCDLSLLINLFIEYHALQPGRPTGVSSIPLDRTRKIERSKKKTTAVVAYIVHTYKQEISVNLRGS